jgi:hypothetical protein
LSSTVELDYNLKEIKLFSVVITEEYNVIVNGKELIRTTEYLTL